jgi:ABC-2 type transport system permease protein
MINLSASWAIALRHIRMWRRDPNFLLGAFYWPLLDILIWGFLGSWIQQSQATQFHNYEMIALLCVLLWQCVGRASNALITCFNEELWSHNIVNLFSLPLRITDWIIGAIIFTGIILGMISLFCIFVCALLYQISWLQLLSAFCIFALPLFICGIWVSFMALQIIVLLGKRSVELGYVIVWFLLPFSGAYYPVEVLPVWGQTISTVIPMSYLFQGMRAYLMYDQNPTAYLITGSVMALAYASVAILLFVCCFKYSKRHGLARLAD